MKITLLTGRTFNFSEHFGFNIRVIQSRSAKRLALRIDEKNHCPVLTIPHLCSQKRALSFLEDNHDWMINMLARLPKATGFYSGAKFSFFGEEYTVQHQEETRGAAFENGVLKIGGNPEFLHRRVTDFLKEQTLKRLSELTVETAKKIGCRVANVVIKDTKSRWGSCSSLHNINYNWRICMAPPEVIKYLVCHEVAHLKHQDHSAAFWKTVQSLCPDYEASRRWLKIKGKDLYKYI